MVQFKLKSLTRGRKLKIFVKPETLVFSGLFSCGNLMMNMV